MKQIWISFLLVATILSLAASTKAQIYDPMTFQCSGFPAGAYTSLTPVSVCNQTTPLSFKVLWDCHCDYQSFGPDPYRFNCILYRDGVAIGSQFFQGAEAKALFHFNNIPSVPGYYKAEMVVEVRKILGWETITNQGNNWYAGTILVIEEYCCPSDVWLSGTYNAALQESDTWIQTTGTTTIPNGANVKWDAAPRSYIELHNGFEAQEGSVFLAQAYNGCAAGAPQRPANEGAHGTPFNGPEKRGEEALLLYPNPASDYLMVKHSKEITQLQLYSLAGERVLTVATGGRSETRLDLTPLTKGIYFVKAVGLPAQRFVKRE